MICQGVGISGVATAPTDFTGILSETKIPKILLPFIDLFSIFFLFEQSCLQVLKIHLLCIFNYKCLT